MGDENVGLTLEQRRALYVALVAAQDNGLSVWDSRELIARRFGVDALVVREVESEGLKNR